jgi:hypothetical protein
MGDTNLIQIQIPTCSSNYQISKDIYSFLNKQGNHIPLQIQIQKNGSVKKQKQSGGFTIPFFGNMFAKPETTTTTTTTTTTPLVEEEEKKETKETNNSMSTKPDENDEKNETKQINTTNNHDDSNNIYLQFQNKTHTLDNIKGTKLYYLYLRNGECARWV